MTQAKVLCVGVAVLDNIFAVEQIPREPTKVFAKSFGLTGGGPAANGAVTAARLGGAASLWARVGDDAVGQIIVGELAGCGVDVSLVRRIPGGGPGSPPSSSTAKGIDSSPLSPTGRCSRTLLGSPSGQSATMTWSYATCAGLQPRRWFCRRRGNRVSPRCSMRI
jgi:hypothetical protein